jgi:hypothetical protein
VISQLLRSARNLDRLRRSLGIIAAVCCLTLCCQIELRGEGVTFFATKSLSRASLVPGASGRRVSLGPTPPSTAGKRWFAETKRDVPANQRPGLRLVKKEAGFKFSAFREFGYRQAGATAAPGATRVPPRQ